MVGHRDPPGPDPEARFARAFQELLELTWAEHQALVDQLEQVVAMERQLLEVWRSVGGRRPGLQAARQAAQSPGQGDPAGQVPEPAATTPGPRQGPAATPAVKGPADDPLLTDLPGVGKIRAKSLEDAGYDLARLAEATPDDLAEVRGIGTSVASGLIDAARELHDQGA